MADTSQRSSEIRDWLQTLVVVAGVGLGAWEFAFKEILTPASAPINITTEVKVKEAGFRGKGSGSSQDQFEAIELSVSAKNPSTRDVFLLKNCWHAQGLTIITRKENEIWTDGVTREIARNMPTNEGAYYTLDKNPFVEAGEIFTDVVLHPNEVISASTVFYVLQDVFDMLYVHVTLPTTAVRDTVEVAWTVTPDNGCTLRIFRKRNGASTEDITDLSPEHRAYLDHTAQFQTAKSTQELSLWQGKRN